MRSTHRASRALGATCFRNIRFESGRGQFYAAACGPLCPQAVENVEGPVEDSSDIQGPQALGWKLEDGGRLASGGARSLVPDPVRKDLSRELGWSPRDWSGVLSCSHGSSSLSSSLQEEAGARQRHALLHSLTPRLALCYVLSKRRVAASFSCRPPPRFSSMPCPSNAPRWTRPARRPLLFPLLALCCSRRLYAVLPIA